MLKIKEIVKASNGILLNGNEDESVRKYCIDSRQIQKNDFFIPFVGENVDGHNYIIDCVKNNICGYFINSNRQDKNKIIEESKKINKNLYIIEVEDTKKALYDIAVFNRQKHINIPIIAVTGSVGKTSTKEMIASILSKKYNVLKTEKNYNSDIGLPLMLLKIESQDICVLEVGISKIDEMEKLSFAIRPDIAVITMIGTSHIGYFKTQENIFREKRKVYKYMKDNGTIIVNGDDKYLKNIEEDKYRVQFYSFNDIYNIVENEEKITFDTKIYNKIEKVEINAFGKHNIYNSLCAIKVAQTLNIDTKDIIQGMKEYKNYERRMQKIKLDNGCILIDDAYNASYDSIKSGLETLNQMKIKNKIVIIGDILEQGDLTESLHRKIGKLFKSIRLNQIYCIGSNSKYIKEEILSQGNNNVIWLENNQEIIKYIKDLIKPETIIYFKASNSMNFKQIIDKFIEESKK